MIEQDRRGTKRMTHPMMGFEALHSANATLAGIELHRMLKKRQHVNIANQSIFEQFYALSASYCLGKVDLLLMKLVATEPFVYRRKSGARHQAVTRLIKCNRSRP